MSEKPYKIEEGSAPVLENLVDDLASKLPEKSWPPSPRPCREVGRGFMQPIHVRAEKSGRYTRLTWLCPFTGDRKRENIGLTERLGRRGIKDAITAKTTELNNDPALAARGRMTLGQWRARFLATADLATTSLDDLGWTFDRLEEKFGADLPMPTLDAARARDFVKWLEKREYRGAPVSVATVRKHVRNCKTICARAVVERATTGMSENPFAMEKSSVPKIVKDWATVGTAEMGAILAACPCVGWRCMFALCRYAGLRQQEAYRLEWGDINWEDPARLNVVVPDDEFGNAQDEDTKARFRVVPIDGRLLPLLREAFEHGAADGPCRDLPATNKLVSQGAARITRRAGIVYEKPLHTLRKNLQTEWTALIGKDRTCELLGNSPEVADKHYIAPATLEDMKKVVAAVENRA